jgi:hypothetical protein
MSDSELDNFRKGLLAEVNGVVNVMGQEEEQQRRQQEQRQLATEPLARAFSHMHLEQDGIATTLAPSRESPHLPVDVE